MVAEGRRHKNESSQRTHEIDVLETPIGIPPMHYRDR